jgi:hypothetical protein
MVRDDDLAKPDERRAAKTREKIRARVLPPALEGTREVSAGDNRPCDGCGETIDASETLCVVTVWMSLYWRLHEGCFAEWLTRQPHEGE